MFRGVVRRCAIALVAASGMAAGDARADDARADEPVVEDPPPPPPSLLSVEPIPSPPPRPAPLGPLETDPPPWRPHLDIGVDLAFVTRPVTTDPNGAESGIRYDPALGFGLHAGWAIFDFLRFGVYFVDADHTIRYGDGALGLAGRLSSSAVDTFSFGARVSPTLHWSKVVRSWITAGAGWGRYEFDRVDVFEGPTTEGEPSYVVRDRSTPFIEFPFGVGGAIDVWPRWLSLVIELTAAPVVEQGGNALETFQTIDASGRKQPVGPYPDVAGHFVQTIGLSLLL